MGKYKDHVMTMLTQDHVMTLWEFMQEITLIRLVLLEVRKLMNPKEDPQHSTRTKTQPT